MFVLAFGIGGSEIIVVLVIVLLFFGGKKIPELMRGLGKGVKEFKDASKGEDANPEIKEFKDASKGEDANPESEDKPENK